MIRGTNFLFVSINRSRILFVSMFFLSVNMFIIYHLSQPGAASIYHEGMSKVNFSTVHLELDITELRVVYHAAQVRGQSGQRHLKETHQHKTSVQDKIWNY